ncbi:MAG TPA: T9SS type A sorting domain-containing protein [Bacteroidia bacterium]|nr:T9SS type A sorting domain-containing protein [Bacteroidia bacterium]
MRKFIFFFLFICGHLSIAQPQYKDVAPIFFNRCTSCHNQNGVVSFLGYSQTLRYTSSIRAYLSANLMPAWLPDTNYTRFMHERFILPAEKTEILNWIARGANAGDTTLAPPTPVYPRYQLKGKPDLVVKIRPFTSNAVGQDAFNCFSLPTGLTQDRYLRAYEVVPGNPSIIHHIMVCIDTTGKIMSDLSGSCYNPDTTNNLIGGYAPGTGPTVFPSGATLKLGTLIKAGSNIILQIHYPLGTAGQVDSTQVRFYFYPLGTKGIREIYSSVPLTNPSMTLPANEVTTYTARYPKTGTLSTSISLFSIFPHSHLLDTSIQICAYMGTDTIPLIRINNWNFNQQQYYVYHHLVRIPSGYCLYAKHVYNNTARNPNNPNSPPQTMFSGHNSKSNEMLFDGIEWMGYQEGDENLNLDSLIQLSDSSTIPTTIEPVSNFIVNDILAYPNPSNGTFTLVSSQHELGLVTIYNLFGQIIYSKKVNSFTNTIDLSNEPSGIYIMQAGEQHIRLLKN